jgi:hypothetical protein
LSAQARSRDPGKSREVLEIRENGLRSPSAREARIKVLARCVCGPTSRLAMTKNLLEQLPILEAAKANELLESGQVIGNIVLLAPELL